MHSAGRPSGVTVRDGLAVTEGLSSWHGHWALRPASGVLLHHILGVSGPSAGVSGLSGCGEQQCYHSLSKGTPRPETRV